MQQWADDDNSSPFISNTKHTHTHTCATHEKRLSVKGNQIQKGSSQLVFEGWQHLQGSIEFMDHLWNHSQLWQQHKCTVNTLRDTFSHTKQTVFLYKKSSGWCTYIFFLIHYCNFQWKLLQGSHPSHQTISYLPLKPPVSSPLKHFFPPLIPADPFG